MVFVMLIVTALFAVVAVVVYRSAGWGWLSVGMALATVVGLGGIIESLVLRILLRDNETNSQILRRWLHPSDSRITLRVQSDFHTVDPPKGKLASQTIPQCDDHDC